MGNTIVNDLNVIDEVFKGVKYKKIKNDEIDYTVISISTYVYESVIHSGLFTFFKSDTQIQLDNFYYQIKLHNEALQEKIKIETNVLLLTEDKSNKISNIIYSYEKLLTNYEKEIKERLTQVKDLIQKEFIND